MGGTQKSDEELMEYARMVKQKLDERAAAKAEKEAAKKARWDEYYKQLEKGNSNVGKGATHKRRRHKHIWKMM